MTYVAAGLIGIACALLQPNRKYSMLATVCLILAVSIYAKHI